MLSFPSLYSPEWIAKTPPNSPTIEEHTKAVSKKAVELFDTNGNQRFIADNTSLDFETVKNAMAYAGYLHDAGKAHPDWQQWAKDTNNFRKPNHSLRSALFALEYLQHHTDFGEVCIASITISILHHHTNISSRNMNLERKTIDANKLQVFTKQFQSVDTDITINHNTTVQSLKGIQSRLRPDSDAEFPEARLLATILRTFLIQADHIISAKERGKTKNEPQQLLPTDFSLFQSRRPFQKQVDKNKSKNHLVGLAGCGEGKTHAALQWGKEKIEKGDADGLVFALPTQTTTNNMYLNLTQEPSHLQNSHLPSSKCELHHSANKIFYESQLKMDTNKEYETAAFLNERERKIYSAGMTVSTIDHILNTLINKQQVSPLARGNLFNKAIIFDELHAYDDETLSNIISAIQILHKWNIPYFVITATLPNYIEQEIPTENTLRSNGNLTHNNTERTPYSVQTKEKELTPEILSQYIEDTTTQSILVVKNTVRDAQKFAFKLRNRDNISFTYYSSEFTQSDRNKKEKEIRQKYTTHQSQLDENKLNVLITTQVCEISLDISVDKIHTDVAPIDSLLQRMGRLHRKGEQINSNNCSCDQCNQKTDHTYNCIIHFTPEQKQSGQIYPYSSNKKDPTFSLIKKTGDYFTTEKLYSFPKSIEWIENIYQIMDTPDLQSFRYSSAVKEDLLYGPQRWDGDDDFSFRNIINTKQDVFPAKYKKQNTTPEKQWKQFHYTNKHNEDDCGLQYSDWSNCHSALYRFAETYAVPMPRYWIHTGEASTTLLELKINGKTIPIEGTPKVDLNYSYQFGLLPSELENKLDNNFPNLP